MPALTRAEYVGKRVEARMKQRGENMTLRVVSMLNGPNPFKNPPDVSNDLTVTAASVDGTGQAYVGLSGTSVLGRLAVGDVINVLYLGADLPLTVMTMPNTIATDYDGIPQTDTSGNPIFGEPVVYQTDSLGEIDKFPVVPISGIADPTPLIGAPVDSFVFLNDQTVYGVRLDYQQAVDLGWIELDSIAVQIAAVHITIPPKINDQMILLTGDKRSVININTKSLQGVGLVTNLQLR